MRWVKSSYFFMGEWINLDHPLVDASFTSRRQPCQFFGVAAPRNSRHLEDEQQRGTRHDSLQNLRIVILWSLLVGEQAIHDQDSSNNPHIFYCLARPAEKEAPGGLWTRPCGETSQLYAYAPSDLSPRSAHRFYFCPRIELSDP